MSLLIPSVLYFWFGWREMNLGYIIETTGGREEGSKQENKSGRKEKERRFDRIFDQFVLSRRLQNRGDVVG